MECAKQPAIDLLPNAAITRGSSLLPVESLAALLEFSAPIDGI